MPDVIETKPPTITLKTTMHPLTVALISASAILSLTSAAASFISWRWAAATAYLALWPLYYLPEFAISDSILTFWGISTLIALGINYMLPFSVATSRTGMPYIAGGALCGTCVGLVTATQAAIICGSAAGAILGAIAYSRTPRGRMLDFPSSRFFNYTIAKTLPLTVTLSTAGITALAIYQFFTLH